MRTKVIGFEYTGVVYATRAKLGHEVVGIWSGVLRR